MSRRRLISALPLGLALALVPTSAALGDHALLEGEISLSGGSVLLALITSFVTGLICFGLMVWEPKDVGNRSQSGYRLGR
jgi:hypothetical protein